MANRGALGGLSEAALQTALLMDASGRDVVLLETVGVGQAEVDVIDHADSVVLVLMPGSGDSIQALKAGVMEIPDVIVVNKADHPLTDTMVREIKGVLALGPQGGWQVPVIRTRAVDGDGVEELVAKLAEHRAYIEAEGTLAERRRRNLRNEVLAIATQRLRRELEAAVADDPRVRGAARPCRGARARPGERGPTDPCARPVISDSNANAVQDKEEERLPTAIEAVDVRKHYPPDVQALDGVSLAVEAGTIFGVLGPNGAGKSTLTRVLCSLTRPDSGSATVAGIDVLKHPVQVRRADRRRRPEARVGPERDRAREPRAAGRVPRDHGPRPEGRVARALERFELVDAADRQVRTYSGGMARRLDIAMGLLNRPQVLFLDEPTTGLDPEARVLMWRYIENLAADEQMTIWITTHYMDEADNLAAAAGDRRPRPNRRAGLAGRAEAPAIG